MVNDQIEMHKLRLVFTNELILMHQVSSHLLTQLHQLLSLKMNVRYASVNPSRMPATFQDHGFEVFGTNSVHCTMCTM